MTGRDQRLSVQAQARRVRAEADALVEVQAAAEAMRDAHSLRDRNLLALAASRARRINPDLLPERWAKWVRSVREAT